MLRLGTAGLEAAVQADDASAVRSILSRRRSDRKDVMVACLQRAARLGSPNVIPAVLEGVAEPAAMVSALHDQPSWNALHFGVYSVARRRCAVLQPLAAAAPQAVLVPDQRGNTPLTMAIAAGHVEACRILLAAAGRLIPEDARGALLRVAVCAGSGNHLQVPQLRMANEIDTPTVQVPTGEEAAVAASCKPPYQPDIGLSAADRIVRLLMGPLCGANPSAAGENGLTPLHWAAHSWAQAGIFDSLRMFGADVNACDDSGLTPLALAAKESPRMIRHLLRIGANPDGTGASATSPVMQLVKRAKRVGWRSSAEPLRELLQHGANVDGCVPADCDNPPPLFRLTKLVSKYADRGCRDAAVAPAMEAIRVLLRHGANPARPATQERISALQFASGFPTSKKAGVAVGQVLCHMYERQLGMLSRWSLVRWRFVGNTRRSRAWRRKRGR